ncbi:MAG: PhoD-like phosphatase [Xenococcaceae cyanobacterium]
MSWINFRDRLPQLPLMLAGPILRHTDSESISVWLVLKEPRQVKLEVYATTNNGETIDRVVMFGEKTTIALGKYLHIVVVTASGENLRSGQIYAYDLSFGAIDSSSADLEVYQQTLQQAITSESLPLVSISYFFHQLPTFSLPPEEIDRLQLVHGSCRKPHGEGYDALPILDILIDRNAGLADDRPHQLLLTGDQIYGDDVADCLLGLATELGDTLLGWEEQLPLETSSQLGMTQITAKQLHSGKRSAIAEMEAGFTAGVSNKESRSKSHLFSLGEYCAIYLLSLSPAFWLESIPKGKEIKSKRKDAKLWDKEVKNLQQFVSTLWQVRRALANIPTYTIFDDHDVSDDWYLNKAWCLRVLGKPLGRRVLQNALLAYAFFQGWGNTPKQFEKGQSGFKLLLAAREWSRSAGTNRDASFEIARYLGLPGCEPGTGLPKMYREADVLVLDRDEEALDWHYTIRSACHQIIVLDTRTWRGYPADSEAIATPMLLCPSAFEKQLRQVLGGEDRNDFEATLVVAPTNLFSLRTIDRIQQWYLKQGQVFSRDVGDSWNINTSALAELLATLFEWRDRIIILSGDIHYSSAVRLDYWLSNDPYLTSRVLVQLTSSSLNNAELLTQLSHTKIKSILFREPQRYWSIWQHPWQMKEVKNLQQISHLSPDRFCTLKWIRRQPVRLLNVENTFSLPKPHSERNNWLSFLPNLLKRLWHNKWLQEGTEVVGVNNIGLVRFDRSDDEICSIVQNTYWYASWYGDRLVYSRFHTSLQQRQLKSQL